MDMLVTLINCFFADVASDIEPLQIDRFVQVADAPLPEQCIVSVEQTFLILHQIQPGKSQGPDHIPGWLLQMGASVLAEPVCSILNASFREQKVPALWKSADICPLPKVPNPTRIEKDLRPISLTPILAKCMERCARPWILEFLDDVLDSAQYGSRHGLCTIDALADLVHSWILAL